MPDPRAVATGSDRCARCGLAFRCGADDAQPCACAAIRLDAERLAWAASRYSGCLCLPCLRALAAAPREGLADG